MKYFKKAEFACPCCGKNLCDKPFMDKVDKARSEAGVPFVITSGYRCPDHNLRVGGKSDSSHPMGCACDIEAEDSRSRFLIIDGLIKAGFNRIGIGRKFIHADDDINKDQEVVWLY